MQRAIAVLDSGVGGLTVVRELMKLLPEEKIIYFGDTARAPYGPRSPEEIIHFTREIVQYLLQFQPKLIVIACNTATAAALDPIRTMTPVPVVGVIDSGVRAAVSSNKADVIGVIGTEGTIRSGAYERAIQSMSPGSRIVSLACPRFVPLVEAGLFDSAEARNAVEQSLAPLRGEALDCLILGCTHYPFLSGIISEIMGSSVSLISSAEETALEVKHILSERRFLETSGELPVHQFFCSGDIGKFRTIAGIWLDQYIQEQTVLRQVPHISIAD